MQTKNDKAINKSMGSNHLIKGLIIITFALISFILIENILTVI